MAKKVLNVVNGLVRQEYDKYTVTFIIAADGSGDYTDIQSALNALPSAGGLVYVRAGVYSISSAITFTQDDVALVGEGRQTRILLNAGANCHGIIGKARVRLAHFNIEGNKANQTVAGDGICRLDTGAVVDDVWILDMKGSGIYPWSFGSDCRIVNSYIMGCAEYGIRLSGVSKFVIRDNVIKENGVDGINVYNGSFLFMSGNQIYGNANDSIKLMGDSIKNVILGNSCFNNGRYGVEEWHSTDYNIIMGNYLRDNAAGSLALIGANNQIGHNIT